MSAHRGRSTDCGRSTGFRRSMDPGRGTDSGGGTDPSRSTNPESREVLPSGIGYAVKDSLSAVTTSFRDAQAYDYRPLEYDRKEIRFLRCPHAGALRPSQPIRFEMRTVSLSEAAKLPYYAISYAWDQSLGDGIVRYRWTKSNGPCQRRAGAQGRSARHIATRY